MSTPPNQPGPVSGDDPAVNGALVVASGSSQATPPQTTPTAGMIRTLGLVSAICGLIIVGAYQSTYDAVAANRRIATERAVFRVIPAAKSIAEYVALPGGGIELRGGAGDAPSARDTVPGRAGDIKEVSGRETAASAAGGVKFFAAYDESGQLAGIAAEGGAKGYADTVRIMFGYSPSCQCVIGIGVVAMRETPGIGDKIVTDREFLANFNALDVKLNADLSALANQVKAVKHGAKANPWQIDAIAGATITSRAVGKAINDAAQALLPRLVPNLDKLGSKS